MIPTETMEKWVAASKTPKNEKAADHIVGVALGLNHSAQSEIWNPDWDGDGNIGVSDLLALLSVFS